MTLAVDVTLTVILLSVMVSTTAVGALGARKLQYSIIKKVLIILEIVLFGNIQYAVSIRFK